MSEIKRYYKRLADWLDWKKISVITAGLSVLSLLPIVYLSFFNYATGDDLGYGAPLHQVIVRGGDPAEMITAVTGNIRNFYYSYQGTWSSIALFSVEPSIWGERFYLLTTWIALFCLIFCQGLLIHELLVHHFGLSRPSFLFLFSIMVFLQTQYMPYHRSGLFWYTGIAHYVIPYGVCMLGFFWMLRFLADGRWGYLLGCLIAMTYLGGAGYPEVVLAAMVFLIVLIATPIVHLHGKKDLRCVWLLLPFLSLLIGFAISAKAPGNRIRGGAEFGFHIDHAAATIGRALLAGWTDAIHYFIAVRPMMLFLILIIVCAWETLPVSDGCFCQKHPILILAGLYLIFSAIHAPELYVGEDVMAGISGGVYNSYFFVFTCCILLGTVTVTGWMKSVYQKKKSIKAQMLDTAVGSDRKKRPFAQWVRIPCLLMILLFCLVFRAHLIGGTTDYVAIEYIRSGQLADFRRQMKDRLEILENPSIRDAVLDPINDWQGPFMHFPVGDDPKSFVNLVTAEFYDKDSVVVRKD